MSGRTFVDYIRIMLKITMSLRWLSIWTIMSCITRTQILWIKTLPIIQFILYLKIKKLSSIFTIDNANSYSFESVGVQQRRAYGSTFGHYRIGVYLIHMIMQGTTGTCPGIGNL